MENKFWQEGHTHKLAKELKHYEASVAKKQLESENEELMNCLCF